MSHVVVIGSGPAGLTAAAELRRARVERVTVIEREREPGGIPRHTEHLGFGVRDLHRVTTGPRYAERLVRRAERAGAVLRCAETVIDVRGTTVVLATGDAIAADAVVLATGVRERPRSARLVPGDRPSGVLTTGALQQLTALHERHVGRRAVIVGAEHVSFSAIWSLRHGGCEPVAMITPLPRHQTTAVLRLVTAVRHGVPVLSGVHVAEIVGRRRVQAVVLSDGTRIGCDTVVFTGDWIADHELARRAGLTITPATSAPTITAGFHTSAPGVFAAGNLVHPAETADVCALDGRATAAAVTRWLADGRWPSDVAAIEVEPPLAWASHTARGVTVRVAGFVTGRLELRRGDEVVHTARRRSLVPNRSYVLPAAPDGPGPLTVRLRAER